tara:strand:+ start:738 stop:1139 length:402 start_codon:yes stop_codon:yes gene_type:complete
MNNKNSEQSFTLISILNKEHSLRRYKMAKMNRKQLRKLILQEMGNPLNPAYAQGMDTQRAIADRAAFPAADHVIDGLLKVLEDMSTEGFESDEARGAIMALQDVRNADELMSALADVESFISDALRAPPGVYK